MNNSHDDNQPVIHVEELMKHYRNSRKQQWTELASTYTLANSSPS